MNFHRTLPVSLLILTAGCSAGGADAPPPSDASEGEGEGEGVAVGEGEGEGVAVGEGEGEGEGVAVGEGEGEGEGVVIGEGEGEGGGVVGSCGEGEGVVAGCVADGDDFACTLEHDGLTREYVLHVPTGAGDGPAGTALVFNFHGLNTTAGLQRAVSRMNANSDEHGYVVVYPKGVGLSWNAGFCCGDASSDQLDDVGFTLAIIEQVAQTLCIDRTRIYATGLSNGGHMSYRLACEQSEVFAAISSVAGLVTTSTPCAPSRPVPVLHFHGTADNIVSYSIGINGVYGAERCVEDWAEHNSCSEQTTVTYQQGEVTCRAHTGCADGATAELCTIDGGGHQWPGGTDIPFLGHNTDDVDATARIWDFFDAHRLR